MPKKGERCTEKQLAALHAGKKDFISGDERTKAIQAQGTKAAAEKRTQDAERRTFAQHLAEELEILNKDGEPVKREIARKFIQTVKNATPKTAAKLFEVLRDTLGEAPTQKIDINANVKSIGNWRDIPGGEAVETAATVESETNSGEE